ncbi:glycosyl hydrolase [Microthyrium microscopicum]|uniref:Glycosyl hydrolase n=1 Tax=Microthyrium microscopicum TaxID=703497 RepID=A0A6A6U3M1_9PEZI|nr:glycosyl hydrolase [Microthyrium microscopicum]
MFTSFLLLPLLVVSSLAQQDYTQYVDVFFGTGNGGNMFPGVVGAPFAPVKLGPDANIDNVKSGFDPSSPISGFSLMHETGTGGAPKYGTVSQLPVLGNVDDPLASLSLTRAKPDNASLGYYQTSLSNGIVVELAASEHAGFFKYTFPPNKGQAGVVVDVSHFLTSKLPNNLGQSYSRGSMQTYPDGHYTGSGTYHGGWNLAPDWTVYFCGRFRSNSTSKAYIDGTFASGPVKVGAVFQFDGTSVASRVGFSFISTEKACTFLDEEITATTTLQNLVDISKAKWNVEVFSKVRTTEKNTTLLGQLYTSLYGMHILPSNRTGDNPNTKWKATDPYYDDFYTLWDLYRCTTPLLQILQPNMYEELIRSVIGVFQTEGYMPDGRSSNFNGRSQGGSSADNILADAYIKGVRGKIDWNAGYAAMVKDAEVAPPPNNDPQGKDSSTKEGRGALPDWINLGYITTKFTRSASRAIEYAGNDFALYQVASGMGKTKDADRYLARSRNWRNHWSPNTTSLGTQGFIVPRRRNGSLATNQNATSCGGCYWGDDYYEAKPWEYSVNAHHDLATLIKYDGSDNAFSTRLNTLLDPKNKLADMGNEPSFGSPYLYNFINQQSLSVKNSRQIAKTQYSPGPAGLPGNSDAGAMQSWLLWNMIGLYPLTGQTTFLIHSPWFSDLTIDLGNGKNLHVTSTGGSDTAIYVQSLKVNGKAWNKNWVSWNDVFASGGTMEFVLGPEMKNWDTGDLPPSPASNGDQTGINFTTWWLWRSGLFWLRNRRSDLENIKNDDEANRMAQSKDDIANARAEIAKSDDGDEKKSPIVTSDDRSEISRETDEVVDVKK